MFRRFISNTKQLQKEIHQDAHDLKPNKGYLMWVSKWFSATPESQNRRNIFWKGPLAVISFSLRAGLLFTLGQTGELSSSVD